MLSNRQQKIRSSHLTTVPRPSRHKHI